MTIPASTVPTAITKILTAIKAQLTEANTQQTLVVVGTPTANLPNTIIQVASDVRHTVDPHVFVGSGGAHWLYEKYTIDVSITCARAVATPQGGPLAAIFGAWALAYVVFAAVRADPSLGGTVVVAYPSRTKGSKPEDGTNGGVPVRIVTLVVSVHCEAEI